MAPVKTLRATPLNAFSQYHRTSDFLQSRVQPYGQTCGFKRSRNKKADYFDIEFVTREDAQLALRKCEIDDMDIIWAPRNLYRKKKRKGLCIASYKSPGCDYDDYSEEPSLPVPTNNPNITKWVLPKKEKKLPQKPAVRYPPRRTQPPPGPNPCGPFVAEVWQELPTY